MRSILSLVTVLLVFLLISACGKSESPPESRPFQELVEQGITRYFGEAVVSEKTEEDGETTYTFDSASGPMCLRGTPYRTAARETGSEDLLIFLSGGGACWSDMCLVLGEAEAGIPDTGILNPELESNPVRDWNVMFLPYCDGSLFAGDADWDDDEDGQIDRYHRGLRNASAALDVARERFPSPRRILLAGSSAGGFGTIVMTVLARLKWPNVPLFVVNDSGVGIVKADQPDFVAGLVEEWGAERLLPASCPDCIANGHLIGLVEWGLAQDDNLWISVFSSYGDMVIATMFLQIGEAGFKPALLEETGRLNAAFPDRYKAFLVEGNGHSILFMEESGPISDVFPGGEMFGDSIQLHGYTDTIIDGISFGEWLKAMIDGDPAWRPLSE